MLAGILYLCGATDYVGNVQKDAEMEGFCT